MRKIIYSTLTAFAVVVLVACSTTSASLKPYPFDECIVSGIKLGTMGDSVRLAYEGQEVKFCCKPCIKKFKAKPDKFLSKL